MSEQIMDPAVFRHHVNEAARKAHDAQERQKTEEFRQKSERLWLLDELNLLIRGAVSEMDLADGFEINVKPGSDERILGVDAIKDDEYWRSFGVDVLHDIQDGGVERAMWLIREHRRSGQPILLRGSVEELDKFARWLGRWLAPMVEAPE